MPSDFFQVNNLFSDSLQGIYRHFLGENEIIKFSDSTKFAISNQWGKGNIVKFINQAKKIGFEIEETS